MNEFNSELCSVVLAADIPGKKLDNPVLRTFLENYTKRIIPSERQLRRSYLQPEYEKVYLGTCATLKLQHKKFFVLILFFECVSFIINALQVQAKVRAEVESTRIWLGVDETTDLCGRFIVNILVGRLNGDLSSPHLVLSREVQATNNVTITQIVLDALREYFF